MSPVVSVRIWFGDGSVSDDWDGSPDTDVQVVAWLHEAGGVTWQWGSNDRYTVPFSDRVKRGAWLPTERFYQIWTEARAEFGGRE